jgi:SAM-dependent methyltransferase
MSVNYDENAREYSLHRRAYPGLVEHLASLVPEHGVVAEIGCGTANHLRGVAELVPCTAVGLDPYARMLEIAATAGGPVTYVQGRANDLSVLGIAPGGADLVFSVDMVHYLDDPSVYAAQVWRYLRPGGYFCTATDSERIIRGRLPMTKYFPGTIPLELERHHAIDVLAGVLRGVGYVEVDERVFGEEGTLSDATRFRDKANSVMHLLPDDEWRAGLARLEADLARGPVPSNNRTCLVTVRKPV